MNTEVGSYIRVNGHAFLEGVPATIVILATPFVFGYLMYRFGRWVERKEWLRRG